MAKRSIGVTIGGTILLLQSAFFLLLLLPFLLTALSPSSIARESGRGSLLQGVAVVGLTFLLTTVTAIGIFRLRPWARLAALIMAGLGLLMNGGMVLGLLIVLPVLRSNPKISPEQVSQSVRWGLLITFLWIGVSFWWFYLLNKLSVKQQFELQTPDAATSLGANRPLSITIIAILLFTAPLGIFYTWQMSTSWSWILGCSVPLWVFRSFMLLLIPLCVCLGVGLWRLKPWARIGTLGYFVFGIINTLLTFRIPWPSISELPHRASLSPDELARLNSLMPAIQLPILIGTVVFLLIEIWFLVTRRKNFYPEAKRASLS